MATAYKEHSGTRAACLSSRLARLLLAGVALAYGPAAAQDSAATGNQPAFADPLAAMSTADVDDTPTFSNPQTGANGQVLQLDGEEPASEDLGRMNLREGGIDGGGRRTSADGDIAPGLRLGTFVLKPSITQGVASERTKTGSTSTSRFYSRTNLRGTLTSDWSRHQLTIDTDNVLEKNISGTGQSEPSARIDADLRLDLSNDMIGNLKAGYNFDRESTTDPNAVTGASTQAGVHRFTGGASLMRDFGRIRGTVGVDLEREIYGSAKLSDGTSLDLSDRDFFGGTLTGRVGFELSPALIPYLEASVGRAIYDSERDSLGYERSSTTLGGRAGVEIDLGEKLRGDLGFGYRHAEFDDNRLAAIDAFAVDGSVFWSPQRGTDLRLGLRTAIEPTTAAGESGYVTYESTAELTHELRENLVGKLTGGYTWRDMPSGLGPDQNVFLVGGGLTWDINRWLALTGDVSYELTTQSASPNTGVTRAGIGLVLRR